MVEQLYQQPFHHTRGNLTFLMSSVDHMFNQFCKADYMADIDKKPTAFLYQQQMNTG